MLCTIKRITSNSNDNSKSNDSAESPDKYSFSMILEVSFKQCQSSGKRNDKEWYVLYLLLKDVRGVDYFARRRSQLMAHTLQGNGSGTGTRTGNGINGF